MAIHSFYNVTEFLQEKKSILVVIVLIYCKRWFKKTHVTNCGNLETAQAMNLKNMGQFFRELALKY